MTTISNGSTTITPSLVLGYTARRATRNVVHQVIGRPDPDVTLREAASRTGTLRLLFTTETAAHDAVEALASADVWALSEDDLTTIDMRFVASGEIEKALDDRTRTIWTVTADYTEVLP